MQNLKKLEQWLGKTTVRTAAVMLVIAIIMLIFKGNLFNETTTDNEVQRQLVAVTTPTQYAGGQSLSLIGSVRAFTEAAVTTERAGRVVSVNVKLGQQVQAGTIIATLENASERASVLQAEGMYDAAVAASAQSGVGVDEARNSERRAKDSAVSVFKSAYNTTNGVIVGTIDSFFSNPNGFTPGLRITGQGFTSLLNSERVAFQTILPTWQSKVNTITPDSDLEVELGYAKENVQRTVNMIDTFLAVFSKHGGSNAYSDEDLQNLSNTFTGLRSSLISIQSNIDAALSGLDAAADTLRRAELSASGGTTSAADAQVKQALGSLRAAQANLAKTILRTPVSGTVNSLSIRTGDFVNSFTPVAIVANNSALEVVTYISDIERDLIQKGDEVIVEGKYTGRVTEIAPAVDTITRKTEVRIATEGADISNGDTVRISKDVVIDEKSDNTIRVPLTAVKFERENGSVLTVIDGVLVSRPVTLGIVLGGSVEITEGLSADDTFVVDVRGLIPGTEVDIKQ